jgi:hypothetical protein
MPKRKQETKGETMICKALREKNQTEKHKPTTKRDALAVLAPLVAPITLEINPETSLL